MFKQKILKFICLGLLLLTPLSAVAQSVVVQAVDPGFTPNQLISDTAFSDTQTFGGPAGIQSFLEAKGSVLANTDPSFLVKLKEPSEVLLKQGLNDPEPNLPNLRTAAQLIWDASQATGLNPQVILVTLNKEQGLITSESPDDPGLQTALDHAMGFACPDSTGCGDLFPGFYYQLFGNFDSSGNRYLGSAASLMKSFNTPGGRGPEVNGQASQVGDTVTLDNTLGGFEDILPEQAITLLNKATAALYRYTPHVFNGNYNFWRYFISWFRYQNGQLLKLANSNSIYIIQNGLKAPVPQFVATARAINLSAATTVSQDELDDYQTANVYGPADNTVVISATGQQYVFINSVPHPASAFVIKQRGLDPQLAYNISSTELALFTIGTVLPPTDGTIIRGTANPSVYLVANGEIKLYSAYTFAQNKINPKQIITVPDAELASYTTNGFVAPLDGSLVKQAGDSTIYLVQSGTIQPVLADVFKNQGYSFNKVATISSGEITALPTGTYATPKDYTFFAQDSETGPLYEFKQGTYHSISAYVAKQRGITPDYVFSSAIVSTWSLGIPVPPRDATIVKGDNPSDGTIYSTIGGQLRPMTYAYFLAHKISAKKIVTLPQAEVDAYAKGDTLE